MEIKYRIKVTETNNGKCKYTPQINIPMLVTGEDGNGIFEDNYQNIIEPFTNSFELSDIYETTYKTKDDALKVINDYKKFLIEIEGKQTKNITYINID